MKKLIQNRLHNPPEIIGNCFPTVIACFLDKDSPEDVIQIQEYYEEEDWNIRLYNWLIDRGWQWGSLDGHLNSDEFYLVSGLSKRGTTHVCIYQNGKLFHDPHPDQTGLIEENTFEYLRPRKF